MCVAYPGRVLSIEGGMALVETERRRRTATTLLAPEAAAGDWVVVSGGAILRVLDPAEAAAIRQLLDDAKRAGSAGPGVDPTEAPHA